MSAPSNVILVGAGGIGKRHIRALLATGRARVTIVEPFAERRAAVQREYAIERAVADLAEIDLAAADLAVICAPAHLHIPLAQRCADAGVSFLLEKPLSTTLDGVDRLIRTVADRRLVARVAFVRRPSPEVIALRDRIRAGEIGDVRLCYLNASQDFRKYRPDYRETYYAREASGGGAILDCASHFIDLLLWFFGAPAAVAAMADRLVFTGVECEDTCLITVRFRNGALAQLNVNQFQKPNTATIEMIGSEGNLMMRDDALHSAKDDSGRWLTTEFRAGLTGGEFHQERFRRQADFMLDALAGRPDPLTTLPEALLNLRVALAAKESARTNTVIQLQEQS